MLNQFRADHDDDDGSIMGTLPIALGWGGAQSRGAAWALRGGRIGCFAVRRVPDAVVYIYFEQFQDGFARRKDEGEGEAVSAERRLNPRVTVYARVAVAALGSRMQESFNRNAVASLLGDSKTPQRVGVGTQRNRYLGSRCAPQAGEHRVWGGLNETRTWVRCGTS